MFCQVRPKAYQNQKALSRNLIETKVLGFGESVARRRLPFKQMIWNDTRKCYTKSKISKELTCDQSYTYKEYYISVYK